MKNEKTTLERIDYIDVFKCFGIILMIMGHIGYGGRFDFFIHAFHMPMFFWISGFLFKHKTKSEMSFLSFVSKKAKTLLIPYAVFGIFHYSFYILNGVLRHKDFQIYRLLHLLWDNTTKLPICGALWFLTAFFFANIWFFLIDRYITNKYIKYAVVTVIAVFGNVLNIILPFKLPYALGASFVGTGLFEIGHLFRINQNKQAIHKLMNLSWIYTIILGVITTVLIFVNGYANMRAGTYSIIPLFWLNAVLSIIVGVNLAKLINPYTQNIWLGKWFNAIGRNSVIYVCLNQLVILIITQCIGIITLPIVISKILIPVLSLAALYIISNIITNTRLKVIIGKQNNILPL